MLTNIKKNLFHKSLIDTLGIANKIIFNTKPNLSNLKIKPILFDVSLRDGLQCLTKQQQENIKLHEKINIYHELLFNYNPDNIEIGSIVSPKLLPIFNDTLEMLNYTEKYKLNSCTNTNHYVLIPNSNKLKEVINLKNIHNFSFLSSVSNSFQLKNTNKSINQNIHDLKYMLNLIDNSYIVSPKTKLYISCINECPIEGKIDKNTIVNYILLYNNLNFNTICLSDTCGTLTLEDFNYIIEKCSQNNMNLDKLSLHLHVNPEKENVVEQIIHSALSNNILQFDVSMLDVGGCPMTLSKSNMFGNLNYNLFYKSYNNYISNIFL
jgi:hydroxymethylglutaryl-CoA lyase